MNKGENRTVVPYGTVWKAQGGTGGADEGGNTGRNELIRENPAKWEFKG